MKRMILFLMLAATLAPAQSFERDAAITQFRLHYVICECGWARLTFWQRARYWWHDPCKTQVRNVARETGVPVSTLTGK
jgi:hypothetical protein